MTLSLPIPQRKEPKNFYLMPYKITDGYANIKYEIPVGGNDNLKTLRQTLQDDYGLKQGSYVIATVSHNEIKKLSVISENLLELTEEFGATMLFEIDPVLNP